MAKRYELDKHKNEIINLYKDEKLSCNEIAKIFGYSLCGIYDALKRWNINTRNLSDSHKVYVCNEVYFEEINSEEKAYWLGFIYADGYITNDTLGISLSSLDEGHLRKFKTSVESTYPINRYKSKSIYGECNYSRMIIKSKKIVEDLRQKGVLNNKSLILKFPDSEILNESLHKDFIRGYFDGDGTLVLSKNSINFKICGTRELLEKMIDIFNENSDYNFKKRLFKRWNNEKNNYYLSYGGRNKTLSIMNYLYNNSKIYLDRKYDKYNILKNMK